MSDTTALPSDPMLERRAMIRAHAASTYTRRVWYSRIFMTTIGLAFIVSLVPLVSVLYNLASKGWSFIGWKFFTTNPAQPSFLDPNALGGVGPAVVGTIVVTGIAALIAVPIALVVGLYLSESNSRPAGILRRTMEILAGMPSILFGIFAIVYIVNTYGSYTGMAGSVALAMLMLPVIIKASETAFRSVPSTLHEAGLALGARQSRIVRRVTFPTALPGVVTGVLLALSRALGETAPVLLVIGVASTASWAPFNQQTTMSLQIYDFRENGSYQSQFNAAWGVALALVAVVLVINISSRLLSAWLRRERR